VRVTVDFTPSIQGHVGIGRYTGELTRALLSTQRDCEIKLFYADPESRTPGPPFDTLPRTVLSLPNKLWRMAILLCSYCPIPLDRLVGKSDIFHATDHLLPPLRLTRSVFTLYDLTCITHPETHLPLNRYFSQLMMPRFLRAAHKIIAISECTKQDAVRLYGIEETKITVIHGGVDSYFSPASPEAAAAVRLRYNLPERYILYVGTIEPRKNLITLLEAYRALRNRETGVKLVIVGKKGWRYENFFEKLEEIGLEDDVVFPGFVPDQDLPAVYTMADVFAFPSLYEGFGLPVLEAMACGTPVVCSNTSSLPEVAGKAAVLVSPQDVRGWREALDRILTSDELRADLRQHGLRQAAGFTWESAARKTCDAYREVYGYCD